MTPPAWQVRITDYDAAVPLDQLLSHPSNPKIHPIPQTDALKGILSEVGWLTGLIVNSRTGFLLDGHDRVKAAMQAGQTTAPVFYVDVDPDQEAYVLATFDPVGALAATDSAALDALLRDVQSGDSAVQALLADSARRAGLYGEAVDPAELWQGMPDFENAGQAVRTLHVYFLTDAACAQFCDLLGLSVTDKTKAVWYPEAPAREKYVFASDES